MRQGVRDATSSSKERGGGLPRGRGPERELQGRPSPRRVPTDREYLSTSTNEQITSRGRVLHSTSGLTLEQTGQGSRVGPGRVWFTSYGQLSPNLTLRGEGTGPFPRVRHSKRVEDRRFSLRLSFLRHLSSGWTLGERDPLPLPVRNPETSRPYYQRYL